MDPFLVSLANLGGGFTLAAAILWLHRESLRTFRQELAEERKVFARAVDVIESDQALDSERHQQISARLDVILAHTRGQLHPDQEHACSICTPPPSTPSPMPRPG